MKPQSKLISRLPEDYRSGDEEPMWKFVSVEL